MAPRRPPLSASAPGNAEDRAGAVFEALADPTRRAVLRAVAETGPRTATELAELIPVSRQAITKHLGVLRAAALVDQERQGRETRWTATTQPLAEAGAWLRATGSAWDDRLDRLARRAAMEGRGDGRGAAGPR